MGLGQVGISVCNDGNVSQIDVTDVAHQDPYYRIEVYRASQPSGGYGVTLSGSRAEDICGADHLSPISNRIFRYVFSLGERSTPRTDLPVTIEGWEQFNPINSPDGSVEVRLRDLDPSSESYGAIWRATVQPQDHERSYALHYELRMPEAAVDPVRIGSPLPRAVALLNPRLPDLGSELGALPPVVESEDGRTLRLVGAKTRAPKLVRQDMRRPDIDSLLEEQVRIMDQPRLSRFKANLDAYEAFGDFGAKTVHPGTNLIGPNARLAAEAMFVRQYRIALILMGRLSSPEMAHGADEPRSLATLRTNTYSGVYGVFVMASLNDIAIHKLGLDKVHSDYGGIPMGLAPGSRLENDAVPVADAWRVNQTLGDVAAALYLADRRR